MIFSDIERRSSSKRSYPINHVEQWGQAERGASA